MIPNYQITGQSVTPQEILDVIPEQENLIELYKRQKKILTATRKEQC